jgi:UDP-glucose 4-epimerase
VADVRRARERLGFTCQKPGLDEIVASAWPFQCELLKRK